MAYQSLEDKYTHQAILMKEASEALQALESQVSAMQKELTILKHDCEADIPKAVDHAVLQYQHQLSSAQSHALNHQSAITKLQDQVRVLQVSLASQRDLPSVGASQGEVDLQEEVFNFVPGIVNTNSGTTVCHSPDQPFQFQKQVRFGDRSNVSDLESGAVGGQGMQPSSSHIPPYASMPFHGASQVLLNCTFDMSRIPAPNTGNAQDAASIAAEVLAAVAAQASKEFWCMWEPKITKLWGGYSADARLIFWSW